MLDIIEFLIFKAETPFGFSLLVAKLGLKVFDLLGFK
jgi:hypothetical protein